MAIFKWIEGEVPHNIEIRQVYGLIFTRDGRMLLKLEDGKYSFAGGTPESFDSSKEDTLKRELIEEVNTTINEPIMVGYQLVDEENGIKPYAQVRMMAMIDEIGEVKPDPDNGKVYQRVLTTPKRVVDLLGWGEVGRLQVEAACKVAKEKFNIENYLDKEEYI